MVSNMHTSPHMAEGQISWHHWIWFEQDLTAKPWKCQKASVPSSTLESQHRAPDSGQISPSLWLHSWTYCSDLDQPSEPPELHEARIPKRGKKKNSGPRLEPPTPASAANGKCRSSLPTVGASRRNCIQLWKCETHSSQAQSFCC